MMKYAEKHFVRIDVSHAEVYVYHHRFPKAGFWCAWWLSEVGNVLVSWVGGTREL